MDNESSLQVGYFFPTAIGVCRELVSQDELIGLQQASKDVFANSNNSDNANWLSGNQSPYNTMATHNIATDNNPKNPFQYVIIDE